MRLRNFVEGHKKLSFFILLFVAFLYVYDGADREFQADSEALVTGAMLAEKDGVKAASYGMGRYTDIYGTYMNSDEDEPLSGKGVSNGYMTEAAGIVLKDNGYVEMLGNKAKYAEFADGQLLPIDRIETRNYVKEIYFDSHDVLTEERSGKLSEIKFLDEAKNVLPAGILTPYSSQYGLPGKAFAALAGMAGDSNKLTSLIDTLHFACIALAVIVFIAIGYYIGVKYNNWLLATVFWLTFLTATWVRDFAGNLYWVEFTWFVPMLIGLYCSIKGHRWQVRWLCYAMAFLALLVKSLSGYEYLSTIMLAMVMFPITDFYMAWHRGQNEALKKAAGMIVGLGLAGLLGFGVAISMHAELRGDGNVAKGLESIYQNDVLRRTWNEDARSNFGEIYQESFNAGLLVMAKKYILLWNRDVVFHLPGRLFIVLFLLPGIMYYCYSKKKKPLPIGREIFCLYVVSFAASFSWFALAKSHSYIHTFINFVVWYFGFVQICVYIAFAWIRDRYFADNDAVMAGYDKASGHIRGKLAKALGVVK